ncbi:fimbrillin family protein [Bacteroides sp. 519]|uniref:fimbrillin family protein n=1 Tax=Bacteroides sp. 519 TaxID=2302937 RepID=UPI0013D254EC|nr:fimbrillin family protein [Bacteroides sp. 519]NDV58331.1 hypothetical protein [Bacteroides sp. 519]
MKRIRYIYGFFITVAFCFSSCEKNIDAPNYIEFGGLKFALRSEQTRSSSNWVDTNDEVFIGNMGLYGMYKGGSTPFIDGYEATISSSILKTPYTWPSAADFRFVAFHNGTTGEHWWPVTPSLLNISNLQFTMPTLTVDADNQHDLLYASLIVNGPVDRENPPKLSMVFHHVLTRITFQFMGYKDTKVEGVTLKGVKCEATATSASGTTGLTDTTAEMESKLVWTKTSNMNNPTLTYTSAISLDGDTPVPEHIGTNDNFFLLPHTTAELASVELEVRLEGNVLKKASVPTTTAWGMGQWINYVVKVAPDKIVFAGITVNPWPASTPAGNVAIN